MAPEPRANPFLLGHEQAEASLAEAMRGGRMHHAWLITGPDGIGKATLAYRFARRLLAGHAGGETRWRWTPTHPVFRRVAAGSHADLLTVERAYDEKRKRHAHRRSRSTTCARIGGFMRLTPAEGGWRVVVVDGAEELNQHSANALLKMLEEPPPRAMLLLVCAAPGRLLPTIRSRCRRLRLDAAGRGGHGHGCWRRYLPELAADERGRLVTLAEGSPGRALLLAEEEGLAIAGLVDEVLAALPALPAAPRPTTSPTRWRAARRRSPPSWTCCAPASPPRCATCVRGRGRRGAGAAGGAASP